MQRDDRAPELHGKPPGQRQRLERADRRMRLAYRIDLPLILLAGLMMAIARYL